MPRVKSWGIRYDPAMYHGMDHECRCGVSLPFIIQARVPLLVGFCTNEGPQRTYRAGIGIFQCQSCQEYFWFHLSEIFVDYLKQNAPQWPRKRRF